MRVSPDTVSRLPRAAAIALLALVPLAACSGSSQKAGAQAPPTETPAVAAVANGPIAFERYPTAREDDHSAQISVRSVDGSVRQLTRLAGGAFQPAWSPDGSRILFQRRFARQHQPDRLYTMKADGSDVRPLVSGCTRARRCLGDDSPAFSPDGRRIAFQRIFGPVVKRRFNQYETAERASRVDLMVLDVASGKTSLVKRYGSEPQPGYGATNWSPDGKSLVIPIVTFKHPTKHSFEATALHVIAVNGGAEKRVSPWALGGENSSWSPDGARIVFNSAGGHTPDIYSVSANGSDLRRLTDVHASKALSMQPAWSPDGTQIVFARDVSRRFRGLQIWVMNADGSGQRRLTSSTHMELKPAWGPNR